MVPEEAQKKRRCVVFSYCARLYDGLSAICELRPLAAYFTATALTELALTKTPTATRIRMIQLFIAAPLEKFDLQFRQLHDRTSEVRPSSLIGRIVTPL